MRLFELHVNSIDLKKFEEDCKPWLEATRGTTQYPYHGTKGGGPDDWDIWNMRHRTKPRDSDIRLHDGANEIFEKKFGYPCRDWLFTTASYNNASIYGKAYVIFPIGEFRYLWSPEVFDLTHEESEASADLYHQGVRDETRKEKSIEITLKKIDKLKWDFNKNILSALKTEHEIMLDCEKFYIMKATETYWDTVRPHLLNQGYLK